MNWRHVLSCVSTLVICLPEAQRLVKGTLGGRPVACACVRLFAGEPTGGCCCSSHCPGGALCLLICALRLSLVVPALLAPASPHVACVWLLWAFVTQSLELGAGHAYPPKWRALPPEHACTSSSASCDGLFPPRLGGPIAGPCVRELRPGQHGHRVPGGASGCAGGPLCVPILL